MESGNLNFLEPSGPVTGLLDILHKFEATQLKTNNATPFQSLNLITANNGRWEMCLEHDVFRGSVIVI